MHGIFGKGDQCISHSLHTFYPRELKTLGPFQRDYFPIGFLRFVIKERVVISKEMLVRLIYMDKNKAMRGIGRSIAA